MVAVGWCGTRTPDWSTAACRRGRRTLRSRLVDRKSGGRRVSTLCLRRKPSKTHRNLCERRKAAHMSCYFSPAPAAPTCASAVGGSGIRAAAMSRLCARPLALCRDGRAPRVAESSLRALDCLVEDNSDAVGTTRLAGHIDRCDLPNSASVDQQRGPAHAMGFPCNCAATLVGRSHQQSVRRSGTEYPPSEGADDLAGSRRAPR